MRINDFLSILRGVSNGAFAKSKPHLEDVRMMEFRRGIVLENTHIQKNYHSSEFLQRKVEKTMKTGIDFKSSTVPRDVNTIKAENIIKLLCPHMDPVKRKFWYDIPKNDTSPDLQVERDQKEDGNDTDEQEDQ